MTTRRLKHRPQDPGPAPEGPAPPSDRPADPNPLGRRLFFSIPLALLALFAFWNAPRIAPIPHYMELKAEAESAAAHLERLSRHADAKPPAPQNDAESRSPDEKPAEPPPNPRKTQAEHAAEQSKENLEALLARHPVPTQIESAAPDFAARLHGSPAQGVLRLHWPILIAAGALCLVASAWLATKRRFSLFLLFAACVAVYVAAAFHTGVALGVTGEMKLHSVAWDGFSPDPVSLFFWRYQLLLPAILCVLAAAFLHLHGLRQATYLAAGLSKSSPLAGDRLLEDLRTHGADPPFRKSQYRSWFAHFSVIILIPWLLQLFGCVQDYRVPKGSGEPVVNLVKLVKPKKKKQKKIVLNPNAAIYFKMPDLDESRIMEEVVEMTELKYRTDPNARAGKMGAGGGKKGGWPDGMENALVRFIRLEYNGQGWDDGLDSATRADLNFLDEFHKLTGFKVSRKPEFHPVRLLSKYRKGFAPPFVYMTGQGSISMSQGDIQTLRNYLLGGGLLFADAGSRKFHESFRSLASQLFPNQPLRVIADDDPLFQFPFSFPNGAPPLWHHGGNRALGIKQGDRWVLFYHPGDVNDAWKTGHSGLDPDLAQGAFQLGINIVYYAFTHYLEETREYRK